MDKNIFEDLLESVAIQLRNEASISKFSTAAEFESRVRTVVSETISDPSIIIDFDPHPHGFPDIAVGEFGIEVKFTANDTWRSVANSVLETNRIEDVKYVYLLFGKMGGIPDVRWQAYEQCVMHVRTSHVPRFEVEIGTNDSLFDMMGIEYNDFRQSDMHTKMEHIRCYARSRLKRGERLWWLEDSPGESHTLPIQARLYTALPPEEQVRMRAEAVLLCPQVVSSGRSRQKYNDVVLYLLTYHGVLCHQARDLFSAGSVANPSNDDLGGLYIQRSIQLIEGAIREAALRIPDSLFEEYWGFSVPSANRINEWLKLADVQAGGKWTPSEVLFVS